jgi:hypothetical protein
MKTLIIAVLAILGLQSCNEQGSIRHLKAPIILVAKSSKHGIILRDRTGNIAEITGMYNVARAISDSYNVGDTLK